MDHFGIGAAMTTMMETYTRTSRRTGRTTSLVESVKDGDRIVFASRSHSLHVEQMLNARGVKVECIVVDPADPSRVFERPPSEGRTILDHVWVEMYYARQIKYARDALDRIERESSGFGATHRWTRRQAEELSRWQPY